MIKNIVISLRPAQWIKNLLLFAGIVFSQNLFNVPMLSKVVLGFVSFCSLSSAVYLINDVYDKEEDKKHSVKSKRPIASGQLSALAALSISLILTATALFVAFNLDKNFGTICLIYFVMMNLYTFTLKHIVIIDVLVISAGFFIRAVAGAVVIDVEISKWLIICTIFITLLLGLCKRKSEIVNMADKSSRVVLSDYSISFVEQMITITAASALISYTLYTTDIEVIEKFGTKNLIFTVPFVLYGIFRYLYLIHKSSSGESPEYIFLKDKSMIINFLLYILALYIIIY